MNGPPNEWQQQFYDMIAGPRVAQSWVNGFLLSKLIGLGVLDLDETVSAMREGAARSETETARVILDDLADALVAAFTGPPKPTFGIITGGKDGA